MTRNKVAGQSRAGHWVPPGTLTFVQVRLRPGVCTAPRDAVLQQQTTLAAGWQLLFVVHCASVVDSSECCISALGPAGPWACVTA